MQLLFVSNILVIGGVHHLFGDAQLEQLQHIALHALLGLLLLLDDDLLDLFVVHRRLLLLHQLLVLFQHVHHFLALVQLGKLQRSLHVDVGAMSLEVEIVREKVLSHLRIVEARRVM